MFPKKRVGVQVRDVLLCYYGSHYSFFKDIEMIFCTVLGKKMEYAGERI